MSAQAPGEHCQIQHHRRIRERQIGQVDDHVGLSAQRTDERLAATPLGASILVATAAQDRWLVMEVDDGRESYRTVMGRRNPKNAPH